MTILSVVDYTCPLCHKIRPQVPLLGTTPEDQDAWYLCWCRGNCAPGTRMRCPEDKRDPGPLFERKKPGRRPGNKFNPDGPVETFNNQGDDLV